MGLDNNAFGDYLVAYSLFRAVHSKITKWSFIQPRKTCRNEQNYRDTWCFDLWKQDKNCPRIMG